MTFVLAGGGGVRRLGLVAIGAVLFWSGCTVAMYPGPRRPATETARIQADGPSSVRNIDGMDLPIGTLFTVLPGLHAVTVGAPAANPTAACFKAEAGHRYVVSLEQIGRELEVSVTDVGMVSLVRSVEVAPGATCAAVAASWEPKPRPAPVAPPPATAVAGDAEEDDDDPDSAPPPQVPAPAGSANPPVAAPMAVDSETPRVQGPRPAPSSHGARSSTPDEEDPIWARHPGNGLALELGAFLGGTDLATTYDQNGNTVGTLSGGSGVVLGIGGMWTPLWSGDAVGFGVGAVLSLKYDDINANNSGVSLLRFPVSLAAHAFIHVGDRYWILLRGGLQKELGVTLSANDAAGSGDASLTGSVGALGEAGIYYLTHLGEQRTAILFAFRYTSGTDSNAGGSISSSSGGLVWGLHHNF